MDVKKGAQRSLDNRSGDEFDEYHKPESTISDEEQEGLLHQRLTTRASRLWRSLKLVWLPLALASWILSLFVTWKLTCQGFERMHSWENGFAGDMREFLSIIS